MKSKQGNKVYKAAKSWFCVNQFVFLHIWCLCDCMCTCLCSCMCMRMCMCLEICMIAATMTYLSVCVCVCVYVCVCASNISYIQQKFYVFIKLVATHCDQTVYCMKHSY